MKHYHFEVSCPCCLPDYMVVHETKVATIDELCEYVASMRECGREIVGSKRDGFYQDKSWTQAYRYFVYACDDPRCLEEMEGIVL